MPQPRPTPHTSGFTERECRSQNHQQRESAERDKPPNWMAGFVGIAGIAAVVRKRGFVEGEMNEQKHKRAQPEPNGP